MPQQQKRSLTASLLVLYNFLLLLFAVIFLSSSAYVASQFQDNSWSSFLFHQLSNGGMVAGVLTGLLAVVGLFAASLRKRSLLCCYMISLFIIISLQFSAAAGMTVYSTQFQIRDDTTPSALLSNSVDIAINNALV